MRARWKRISKSLLLKVKKSTLTRFGSVSEETAEEMSQEVMKQFKTSLDEIKSLKFKTTDDGLLEELEKIENSDTIDLGIRFLTYLESGDSLIRSF